MALIRIDWNPGARKVRQFGLLLALFSLLVAAFWAWRGHTHRAGLIAVAGLPLGALTAALPATLGLLVYKGWMGVSFVVGSAVSPIILGCLYYGVFTPIAFVMKLAGRDALRLKRPKVESYWTPMAVPQEKSYLERLF